MAFGSGNNSGFDLLNLKSSHVLKQYQKMYIFQFDNHMKYLIPQYHLNHINEYQEDQHSNH